MKPIISILSVLILSSCSIKPKGQFSESLIPTTPDYSNLYFWAAHPDKDDPADMVPLGLNTVENPNQVDVFFLHPTIYTGKMGENQWNGPVDDPELNTRIDEGTIQYQASIFNEVGRVFAPRYRQAHINAYYTQKTASAEKAFELAYSDVQAAFEYYLANHDQGKPIIIAAHSQGTTHAIQLLKDYFDETDLKDRLVVAYLVGIAVAKEEFENIPPCETADQNFCFCSWRTWKYGKEPKKWVSPKVAVINPISWTTDDSYASKEAHEGAVLADFDEVLPEFADAEINPELGILWTTRPKIFATLFLNGNYHIADFNLYYLDVRENAALRARHFQETNK